MSSLPPNVLDRVAAVAEALVTQNPALTAVFRDKATPPEKMQLNILTGNCDKHTSCALISSGAAQKRHYRNNVSTIQLQRADCILSVALRAAPELVSLPCLAGVFAQRAARGRDEMAQFFETIAAPIFASAMRQPGA